MDFTAQNLAEDNTVSWIYRGIGNGIVIESRTKVFRRVERVIKAKECQTSSMASLEARRVASGTPLENLKFT